MKMMTVMSFLLGTGWVTPLMSSGGHTVLELSSMMLLKLFMMMLELSTNMVELFIVFSILEIFVGISIRFSI